MAAVHNLHVELGYIYPSGPTTLLDRVMRGLTRLPSTQRARLPITMPLLRRVCYRLSLPQSRPPQDKAMLLAAITLGFHAFLRCGELVNLTHRDIVLSGDGRLMTVTLRRSKTDQSGNGVTVHVGQSPDPLICPITAMCQYLAACTVREGELVAYRSRSVLSKQDIPREIRTVLPLCLVSHPQTYASHSLRIGAIQLPPWLAYLNTSSVTWDVGRVTPSCNTLESLRPTLPIYLPSWRQSTSGTGRTY